MNIFYFKLRWHLALIFLLNQVIPSNAQSISRSNNQDQFKSSVFVDYFRYQGDDNFYKENPLPGPDYFYNPILPGWYSDPSICSNGKDYFLVTSTFSYFPGVPIFHSQDLVNWKQIGHVLNRTSQLPLDGQKTSEGIFAPAISYNPVNKTYYMITTNIKKGNFFVKTKDPFGPWSDPIWLPDVHGIDPSFFFDDDGKAYIVNNDAPDGEPLYSGHRAIRIIGFDVSTDKTIGTGQVIVNGGVKISDKPIWIEGPHLYKINGKYMLMAAEGGTSSQHSEVIFRAESAMGKYVPWDKNPILTQRHLNPGRNNAVTCTGHADLIQAKDGDWWAVFLGCRPVPENDFENLGRETFLMPVRWSSDGFPYITKHDEQVPLIVQKKGVTRQEQPGFGNMTVFDGFDSVALSHEWISLRSPAGTFASLQQRPGYFALSAGSSTLSERNSPSFLARRVQHHNFDVQMGFSFEPQHPVESAGVLLYKDESHQYFASIRKSAAGQKVCLEKFEAGNRVTLEEKPVASVGNSYQFRIVSKGAYIDMFYATDSGVWQSLRENVDARYLSTTNASGFTGTTIGIYAETPQ